MDICIVKGSINNASSSIGGNVIYARENSINAHKRVNRVDVDADAPIGRIHP